MVSVCRGHHCFSVVGSLTCSACRKRSLLTISIYLPRALLSGTYELLTVPVDRIDLLKDVLIHLIHSASHLYAFSSYPLL